MLEDWINEERRKVHCLAEQYIEAALVKSPELVPKIQKVLDDFEKSLAAAKKEYEAKVQDSRMQAFEDFLTLFLTKD
jgi:hypothetical protein